MNNMKRDRRTFLKNSLLGAAGLASTSLLASCSTFDDFLFDDRQAFKDEVIIIGAGAAGLYTAYLLKESKSEFRLYEGSNFLGGRIRSAQGVDYGASVLSARDIEANKLVDKLGISTQKIDKDSYYLVDGMQTLTDTLFENSVGLFPYRSYRLRFKLIQIERLSNGFELIFQTPTLQKRYVCKKLVLAIPPSQWRNIKGLLEIPEMKPAAEWLSGLKTENVIRVILPTHLVPNTHKPYVNQLNQQYGFREILKKHKNTSNYEIDIRFLHDNVLTVDEVADLLKSKLQLSVSQQKISADQYFDWGQAQLIKGAFFKSEKPFPEINSPHFQIAGDFASTKASNTVEGALLSAKRAFGLIL